MALSPSGGSPAGPHALLARWPDFKWHILRRCLAGQAAARRGSADTTAALAEVEALHEELERTAPAGHYPRATHVGILWAIDHGIKSMLIALHMAANKT